ncbi:uncharacterized protein LOC103524116 [Trichonephila clavipes]|nr:uncharacterized protein LOC103524116 [Trichonephila clavipes]
MRHTHRRNQRTIGNEPHNSESLSGDENDFHAEIVEVEIGGVAIYRPFGEFRRAKLYCHLYVAQPVWWLCPSACNQVGSSSNPDNKHTTTTCMVLKANDRRTSSPCHVELHEPRSDYVRQLSHIYTDGSLLDFAQGAGIGVFSHLFSFYLHAGPLTTYFDDSTSALQALSNYNENNCLRVQNCRELLGKIKGKIVFQWVPSHCGFWGNERADFLAKKGTGILQNFRRDLTLHSAKLEIKRIFRESFRLTASRVARDKPWSTLCKKSHDIPSSPRAAAVAKFRLLTGHDSLCAHLFRFNLVTSPICVLCDTGQDMTAAHLDECSALNDLNCIVKRIGRRGWRSYLAGIRALSDVTNSGLPVHTTGFLADMALSLEFNESDPESECSPETDEYDSEPDTEGSIYDEEDEEMKQKWKYTYVTHV